MDAIVVWQTLQTGLDGLQRFAKLVQVLSASWQLLGQYMSRHDRKKLQVEKLRKDLLAIGRVLRDAHFAIHENKLLPSDDFLAQELKAVLDAVGKASGEPKLYELEYVMETAAFVQERVTEKLRLLLSQMHIDDAPGLNTTALQRTLQRLEAKSSMVVRVLQAASANHMEIEPSHDSDLLHRAASAATTDYDSAVESESEYPETNYECHGMSSFQRSGYISAVETAHGDDTGYDSAVESESELPDSGDDTCLVEYESCDEAAFWDEARCHYAAHGQGSLPECWAKHLPEKPIPVADSA